MIYSKTVELKNGDYCTIRSNIADDANIMCEFLNRVPGQTDFTLSYPDERIYEEAPEREWLRKREEH